MQKNQFRHKKYTGAIFLTISTHTMSIGYDHIAEFKFNIVILEHFIDIKPDYTIYVELAMSYRMHRCELCLEFLTWINVLNALCWHCVHCFIASNNTVTESVCRLFCCIHSIHCCTHITHCYT